MITFSHHRHAVRPLHSYGSLVRTGTESDRNDNRVCREDGPCEPNEAEISCILQLWQMKEAILMRHFHEHFYFRERG